jgi:endonuclease YncB( thermonuclease family)
MRTPLRTLIATIVATAALAGLAATAEAARRGPCIPGTSGPSCTFWTAKVTFVADGDTIEVDIAGDRTSRRSRVRITGIQAMELTRYSSKASRRRGECHAVAATGRLERLIRAARGRVRLAAQHRGSRTGGRIRRAVSARIGGRWVDLGATLLSEGHALWLPNSAEYAWNRRYSELADRAAAGRLGIWNGSTCGAGPGPESQLRMWVKWDADGVDGKDVNGEWAKIKNLDTSRDVSLAGWWFRDSHHRRYRFPAWAKIPAGETITVRMGRGSSAGSQFFWGQAKAVFENASDDRRAMGDGGYLFDPQGDLRAWMTYPCRVSCADPLRGALELVANPRGADEHVRIKNVSPSPVDLEGYLLENSPFSYSFGPNTILAPGEVLTLDVGGSPAQDTLGLLHWARIGSILNDDGDVVKIRNFTGTVVACTAWGRAAC